MLDREVEILKSEKLLFLGPGALRMGVYLSLQDRIIGIEKTEHTQAKLSPYRTHLGKEFITKLPIIGTGGPGKMPNLEAIMVHKPDLIITSFLDKSQLELISSKTSTPVIALSYGASYGGSDEQLQSVKKSLLLLGKVTNTQKRAKNLVEFIQRQQTKLSSLHVKQKCVYVGGIGYKGAQGLSSTEANYPPFELLGLQNCLFKGAKKMGHHFVDYEALISVDPDMIFVDMFGAKKVQKEYEENKSLLSGLRAYRTDNVKDILAYNFYSTNIENLFVISYQIASYMGVKEIDVAHHAKEIYKAFYGKNGVKLLEKLPYGFSAK